MVKYNKLWKLCDANNIDSAVLFKQLKITLPTWRRMKENEYVSLQFIEKLCDYFKCQPADIMESEV